MWTPTAQPGLWFQSGSLQQSRHFSRYLTPHLKTQFEGLPITVSRVPGPASR